MIELVGNHEAKMMENTPIVGKNKPKNRLSSETSYVCEKLRLINILLWDGKTNFGDRKSIIYTVNRYGKTKS